MKLSIIMTDAVGTQTVVSPEGATKGGIRHDAGKTGGIHQDDGKTGLIQQVDGIIHEV